MLFHKI